MPLPHRRLLPSTPPTPLAAPLAGLDATWMEEACGTRTLPLTRDAFAAELAAGESQFSGLRLEDADLSGRSFAQTVLRGARFTRCVLDGGDFTGADLSGAHFTQCSLRGALFRECVLVQTRLITCECTGAIFLTANAAGLRAPRTSFAESVFDDVNLASATLSGARFPGATLRVCSLRQATLLGTSFTGAVLEEVDLTQALLARADFRHATLCSLRLNYGDLARDGALIDRPAQFETCEATPMQGYSYSSRRSAYYGQSSYYGYTTTPGVGNADVDLPMLEAAPLTAAGPDGYHRLSAPGLVWEGDMGPREGRTSPGAFTAIGLRIPPVVPSRDGRVAWEQHILRRDAHPAAAPRWGLTTTGVVVRAEVRGATGEITGRVTAGAEYQRVGLLHLATPTPWADGSGADPPMPAGGWTPAGQPALVPTLSVMVQEHIGQGLARGLTRQGAGRIELARCLDEVDGGGGALTLGLDLLDRRDGRCALILPSGLRMQAMVLQEALPASQVVTLAHQGWASAFGVTDQGLHLRLLEALLAAGVTREPAQVHQEVPPGSTPVPFSLSNAPPDGTHGTPLGYSTGMQGYPLTTTISNGTSMPTVLKPLGALLSYTLNTVMGAWGASTSANPTPTLTRSWTVVLGDDTTWDPPLAALGPPAGGAGPLAGAHAGAGTRLPPGMLMQVDDGTDGGVSALAATLALLSPTQATPTAHLTRKPRAIRPRPRTKPP